VTEYLITGGTGFVGSHLVEALARSGATARALVRETSDTRLLEQHGIEPVHGSLDDVASLQRALGDAPVVLHLAAATRALRPETYHAVNEVGTERLLDAMEAEGGRRRMVYLSSLAAVGPSRDRPVRPDDEPRPVTVYGRSKLAGERAALARQTVDAAVLRAPAVYGPRDRDLLTFFRFAKWHLLPTAGPPERPIQLVHARDLAEAILGAGQASALGVYHIAEPQWYPWSEVLHMVAAAVGRKAVRIQIPGIAVQWAGVVSGTVARWLGQPVIFDREKARELLAPGWTCETEAARAAFGFQARIPLEEGLRETVHWYRSQGWL
jgi:nucleoside-diphosphate-sugar epimerase